MFEEAHLVFHHAIVRVCYTLRMNSAASALGKLSAKAKKRHGKKGMSEQMREPAIKRHAKKAALDTTA
jgi:hypothetical protein